MRIYNHPTFIHICKIMYTSGDLVHRDEYGNSRPEWEDCDDYVNVNIIRWIKFITFDGKEMVSLSIKGNDHTSFMSDSVKYFRNLVESELKEEE